MRTKLAITLLFLGVASANAQGFTPGVTVDPNSDTGRASDAGWRPQSYGLATAGAPGDAGVRGMGTNPGTTTIPTTPTVTEPPQPVANGKWIGELTCDGMQVCGQASRSRGWGFAVYKQQWTCSASKCDPLPATVSVAGNVCQTSMGDLGWVFGTQCYLGLQPF